VIIYDILGREIKRLVDGNKPEGSYRAVWEGKDSRGRAVPSGVYLIYFQAGNYRQIRELTYLK